MHKRLAALILVGMGLVPAVASAQEAAPPTTIPPAAPVPAPAPTQEPTGLGTNGALDQLASACFNGSMQACDDLFEQARQDRPAYDSLRGHLRREAGGWHRPALREGLPRRSGDGPTGRADDDGGGTYDDGDTGPDADTDRAVGGGHDGGPHQLQGAGDRPLHGGVRRQRSAERTGPVRRRSDSRGSDGYQHLLGTTLDIALRDDEHIPIMDPYELAQAPVGDADLTEWGWLTGAYLVACSPTRELLGTSSRRTSTRKRDKPPGATTAWSGRRRRRRRQGPLLRHVPCGWSRRAASAPVTTVAPPADTPTTTAPAQTPTQVAPTTAPAASSAGHTRCRRFGRCGDRRGDDVRDRREHRRGCSCLPGRPVLRLPDQRTCQQTSTPLPPGTVELATDAACPITGDLEHPDPANEEVFTFTEPSQMRTFIECIIPEAIEWMTWEYGGSLDVPTEWAGSQATSLAPNHWLYVPTGISQPPMARVARGGSRDARTVPLRRLGSRLLPDRRQHLSRRAVAVLLLHPLR